MAVELLAVGFTIFAALWSQGSSVSLYPAINDIKETPDYDYEKNGTDWKGMCQTGIRQSPIVLDGKLSTKVVDKVDEDYQPLVLVNYDIASFQVKRDEKGVSLVSLPTPSNAKLGLAAGGLSGFYEFVAGYFHWPAEHLYYMPGKTENLTRHSLEIHLVHIRDDFKTLDEAVESTDDDAIAILAGLYDVGETNKGLAHVQDKSSSYDDDDKRSFRNLLPNISTFFRYKGSITSPPCSENVVWTVLGDIMSADEEQIEWFHDKQHTNNRKENPVGTRDVFVYTLSRSQKLTGHFIVFFLILWLLK